LTAVSAVSPARKAAFRILMAVETGATHSDDLLRGKSVSALAPPDRHLATALVLGVLRWQIRLDHQFQALLARPNARLDPEIRIALRLGAFQILFMDRIPARAAVDESVELARQAGHKFASGMVNAVLRKLAKVGPLRFSEENAPAVALAQAHPAWMVERWVQFYGLEPTLAICRHGQTQPVLSIRVGDPAAEAELTAAGIALEPGQLLTGARTVVSGDITDTAAFCEGQVRLQDEGSQLVAELAAALCPAQGRILDACAAPGGKTLILAERNPHAHIVACESSESRLDQMRLRLAGLGERMECRLADASLLAEDEAFDLALADVPCSGTGTLGRNPEIRHRLRVGDLPRQAERQRAILTAALRSVRPGGRVLYSTCSLEPEENEQVVAAVLAATSNVHSCSVAPLIDALLTKGILTPGGAERLRASITPKGYLRLLPGVFHTDGFFIGILERTTH